MEVLLGIPKWYPNRCQNYKLHFFFFHFCIRSFCNHQRFEDRKRLWCGIYNTMQTINIVYTLVFCSTETRAALDNQEVQQDRNQRGENNNDQVSKQSVAVYGWFIFTKFTLCLSFRVCIFVVYTWLPSNLCFQFPLHSSYTLCLYP